MKGFFRPQRRSVGIAVLPIALIIILAVFSFLPPASARALVKSRSAAAPSEHDISETAKKAIAAAESIYQNSQKEVVNLTDGIESGGKSVEAEASILKLNDQTAKLKAATVAAQMAQDKAKRAEAKANEMFELSKIKLKQSLEKMQTDISKARKTSKDALVDAKKENEDLIEVCKEIDRVGDLESQDKYRDVIVQLEDHIAEMYEARARDMETVLTTLTKVGDVSVEDLLAAVPTDSNIDEDSIAVAKKIKTQAETFHNTSMKYRKKADKLRKLHVDNNAQPIKVFNEYCKKDLGDGTSIVSMLPPSQSIEKFSDDKDGSDDAEIPTNMDDLMANTPPPTRPPTPRPPGNAWHDTAHYGLIIVGIVVGMSLLLFGVRFREPTPDCVSIAYTYGILGFTTAWYAKDMHAVHVKQAWDNDTLTAYGCAIAGGVVALILVAMLRRRSSSLSLVQGSAFGVVFGMLANTAGLYRVADHFNAPSYMSLTLSLAAGIVIFGFVFFVVATCSKESRGKLSCVTFCIVGGYMLVKSIGYAIGNYPDEWDMRGHEWRDYVYVGSSLGAAILGVIVQWQHADFRTGGGEYEEMRTGGGGDSGACCCCPLSSTSDYDEFEEVRPPTVRRLESARDDGDHSPVRGGGGGDYIEDASASYQPPTYGNLSGTAGGAFYADTGERYFADYSE